MLELNEHYVLLHHGNDLEHALHTFEMSQAFQQLYNSETDFIKHFIMVRLIIFVGANFLTKWRISGDKCKKPTVGISLFPFTEPSNSVRKKRIY